MEISLKIICPTCGGSLVYSKWVQSGRKDGELVWTEFPCWCIDTEFPGYKVLGTIDISDLADTIADIQNKVNDIKQKVDEL